MTASNRFAYLFNRYYEKKCTPSEQDELFSLLQNATYDETLRQLIDTTWKEDFPTYLQDPAIADKILQHIISQTSSPSQPRPVIRAWLKYAAAVIIIAAVSFLVFYWRRPHPANPTPALAIAPTLDQCITLSDGSKVLLHKNAHIDYPPLFNGNTREVSLSGEAYFDIRKDQRPFIVHTGNIKTTVLGTAFNVDANEKGLVITVMKGKVKVENDKGDFSILKRNEQVQVDLIHDQLKKTAVDAEGAVTWKKAYILFNDVTLQEAVAELQKRFHVPVTLSNPASENCHVTASFTQGESLEQVVKVLSKINNMDYKANTGGGFELNGEGCQ